MQCKRSFIKKLYKKKYYKRQCYKKITDPWVNPPFSHTNNKHSEQGLAAPEFEGQVLL